MKLLKIMTFPVLYKIPVFGLQTSFLFNSALRKAQRVWIHVYWFWLHLAIRESGCTLAILLVFEFRFFFTCNDFLKIRLM